MAHAVRHGLTDNKFQSPGRGDINQVTKSMSPLPGLSSASSGPTAHAVGHMIAPLRGFAKKRLIVLSSWLPTIFAKFFFR